MGTEREVRAARPEAKEGDIFTPEIAELFRKLITHSIDGPDGAKIRTSYERAEPIRGVHLAVDQAYPDGGLCHHPGRQRAHDATRRGC